MNEPQYQKLSCQLCSWFGGTTEATHVCYTKTGKEWYVCQFHAESNQTNLQNARLINDMDRKVAYDQKTQEITTRWIQRRTRHAR